MLEASISDIFFREHSIEAMPGVSKRCHLRVVEQVVKEDGETSMVMGVMRACMAMQRFGGCLKKTGDR